MRYQKRTTAKLANQCGVWDEPRLESNHIMVGFLQTKGSVVATVFETVKGNKTGQQMLADLFAAAPPLLTAGIRPVQIAGVIRTPQEIEPGPLRTDRCRSVNHLPCDSTETNRCVDTRSTDDSGDPSAACRVRNSIQSTGGPPEHEHG